MAVSSLSSGASMNVFSSQILFDEKIIDQVGNSSNLMFIILFPIGGELCLMFSYIYLFLWV